MKGGRADMTTETRPPRFAERDSHSPMLLTIAVALGLVLCMLFAQPLRRAYLWIAAAELHLPIEALQQAGEKQQPTNHSASSERGLRP